MIDTKISTSHLDDEESYFSKLSSAIPEVYRNFQPEFVIYNAGTDCMEGDPLGNMNISPEGIMKRD